MKTKEQILAEALGEAAYKKLSAIKMTAILKAMENYKNQSDFPEEAYSGGDINGEAEISEIPQIGIVVDGSTTNGNPGDSEYQGYNIGTKEVLFAQEIGVCTNNVCEFVAIVNAIKYTRDHGLPLPIYSDSTTAMSWIKKREVKSDMTDRIKKLVNNCIKYLNSVDVPEIHKWNTRKWGENPADFNRK